MSSPRWFPALLVAAASCYSPQREQACEVACAFPDGPCPDGFACLAGGVCGAPGGSCESANCIGQPGGLFRYCADTFPTDPVAFGLGSSGASINTTIPAGCTVVPQSNGSGEVCMVAGSSIVFTANTVVTYGSRPLVFVATHMITFDDAATLDASSSPATIGPTFYGPGAPFAGCALSTPGVAGDGSAAGGGAGGSFGDVGGNGGGGPAGQGGGVAGMATSSVTTVRAGCDGAIGAQVATSIVASGESGGAGGGAVYLLAGDAIMIAGKINASGGGALGAQGADATGGNGGGAGGLIGLDAPSITVSGVLIANGGGGSSGGSAGSGSIPGGSPSLDTPTQGGLGGPGIGMPKNGNGGRGGSSTSGPGGTGGNGESLTGGGGGGGGAGVIMLFGVSLSLGGTVSPAPRTH